MSDYISREAMLKNLTADLEHHSDEGDPRTNFVMQRFIKYVEDFPAADVRPVRCGKWIWDSSPEFGNPYGSYACSECNERQAFKENYCPNCGARMKQECEQP